MASADRGLRATDKGSPWTGQNDFTARFRNQPFCDGTHEAI
jgi:hypothetical protein